MRKLKLLTGISALCTISIIPLNIATSCTNNKTINVSLIKGYEKLYKINKTSAPINEQLSVILESKDGVTTINPDDIYVVTKGSEIPTDWYEVEMSIDGLQARITLDKEDVFADIQIGIFDMFIYDYVKDGEFIPYESKYTNTPEITCSGATQYTNKYCSYVAKDPKIFEDDCYCNINRNQSTTLTTKYNEIKAGFKVLDFDEKEKRISYDTIVVFDVVITTGTSTVNEKFSLAFHFENMPIISRKIKNIAVFVTSPIAFFYNMPAAIEKMFEDTTDFKTILTNDKKWKISFDLDLSVDSAPISGHVIYTDAIVNCANILSHSFFNQSDSSGSSSNGSTLLQFISPYYSHFFQNVIII